MKLISRLLNTFKAGLGFPEAILAGKALKADPQTIHIYAMGEIGRNLYLALKKLGYQSRIVGVYDSKAEYNPFSFESHDVQGPAALQLGANDTLIVASVKFEQAIIDQA